MRGGQLAHGGNPVTRWMAANVAVAQDPAGNLKPAKDKSTERIDGIVALIMAIGRAPWLSRRGRSPRTKYSFSDGLDSSNPAVAQHPISNLKPLAAPEAASSSNCGQRAWCAGLAAGSCCTCSPNPLPICTRPRVLIKGKRT